ncbi:hypothetical protein BFS35_002320 [Macrococcoides goetzii]|uniref:Uncharacterized protein n=1 Tax=Macrococcoides goetzii TaxID=1891097 RepID=A0A2G5NU90_9STAP|nr:hypothetical protein [Macrococcus goetzii]RAI82544.1 hypothetical protein BFS35_002320 [Macrococcus goetzii]
MNNKIAKSINRTILQEVYDPTKPTIIVKLKKHNFSQSYKDYIEERSKYDKYYKRDFNKPIVHKFYYKLEDIDLDFITNINNYDFTTYGRSLLTNWVRGEDFDYYIESIELKEYIDETDDYTLDDLIAL